MVDRVDEMCLFVVIPYHSWSKGQRQHEGGSKRRHTSLIFRVQLDFT